MIKLKLIDFWDEEIEVVIYKNEKKKKGGR